MMMMTNDSSPPMKAVPIERGSDPYNRSQEQKHFPMGGGGDPSTLSSTSSNNHHHHHVQHHLTEARQRMMLVDHNHSGVAMNPSSMSSMSFPSSAGMQGGPRFDTVPSSSFRPPAGAGAANFDYPPYANHHHHNHHHQPNTNSTNSTSNYASFTSSYHGAAGVVGGVSNGLSNGLSGGVSGANEHLFSDLNQHHGGGSMRYGSSLVAAGALPPAAAMYMQHHPQTQKPPTTAAGSGGGGGGIQLTHPGMGGGVGSSTSSTFHTMNAMSSYGLNPTTTSSFLGLSGVGTSGVGGPGPPSRFDTQGFPLQAADHHHVLDHYHHPNRNSLVGGGGGPSFLGQGGGGVIMENSLESHQNYNPTLHPHNLELSSSFAPLPSISTAMPSMTRRSLDSSTPSNTSLFGPPPPINMNPSHTPSAAATASTLSHKPSNNSVGGSGGTATGTSEVSDVPTFQKVGAPSCPLPKPTPMAMQTDNEYITPLHCFIRLHCVELFTATQDDVFTPSKGKRRPIQLHQVGIRCPHCHGCGPSEPNTKIGHERGSVYYPNNISSIYNATMNLLQRHLHVCEFVPKEIMKVYNELKADDARSGTSKRYWIDSALLLGLFDTASGIRWCSPAIPPVHPMRGGVENRPEYTNMFNSNSHQQSNNLNDNSASGGAGGPSTSSHGNFMLDQSGSQESRNSNFAGSISLVSPEDKHLATRYSFALLSQMRSCKFTEADRLGKRKGLPINFAGLACSHCYGGYGSGRFFPSTIKTMSDTSKTLNVLHSHMMKCRKCPDEVRERLMMLRDGHDEERARMKFGSQKAFFVNIWQRLHGDMPPRPASKRKRTAQQDSKLEDDQRNKGGSRYISSYVNEICSEASPIQSL